MFPWTNVAASDMTSPDALGVVAVCGVSVACYFITDDEPFLVELSRNGDYSNRYSYISD